MNVAYPAPIGSLRHITIDLNKLGPGAQAHVDGSRVILMVPTEGPDCRLDIPEDAATRLGPEVCIMLQEQASRAFLAQHIAAAIG